MDSERSSLFAEKPVGRLLVRFALPAILALLANSVYHIVDQVFLGKSDVGTLGYGATSVAFPIVTAGNALAFLFGGGGASYAVLRLGEGSAAYGKRALSKSVGALLCSGLVLTVLGILFLRPLLVFFGATGDLLPHAKAYARIMWLGLPFAALASGLSYWIRADGSPGFAMGILVAGAVLNTGLDWLFLFPLHWGIVGAAIATVVAQAVSAALGIWYFFKRGNHFTFSQTPFFTRISAVALPGKQQNESILWRIVALGSPGCLMQCAIIVVQVVLNRSLRAAAAAAAIDASAAIGAMGIVTKVNGILIAIVTGIASGAQPILGFHQGAGHEKEVRKTYWISVLWATLAALVCWGITVFFSHSVAGVFVSGSGDSSSTVLIGNAARDFLDLAALCMRVYLVGIFTAGFQLISCYYFQAIGHPWQACLLTLSRQVLLLAPMLILLPRIFGFMGVLYAGPVADVGAACIAVFFIAKYFVARK